MIFDIAEFYWSLSTHSILLLETDINNDTLPEPLHAFLHAEVAGRRILPVTMVTSI
jgi:hypothetical protein